MPFNGRCTAKAFAPPSLYLLIRNPLIAPHFSVMLFRRSFTRADPAGDGSESGKDREGIPFLQFPRLSTLSGVRHAVFTRQGGVSPPPYHSLNTGTGSGDDPAKVARNLRRIKAVFGAPRLAGMEQVHGRAIGVLTGATPPGPVQCDALMTRETNLALMVRQADCQAVILVDPVNRAIANVHCGWRGSKQDILGAVVNRMGRQFGTRPADLYAAIGPGLGPCCAEFIPYPEILPEDFKAFMVRDAYFDFWEISRNQLLRAGLQRSRIESADLCTRCRTDLFFSYRAEGTTGRFATLVMLTPVP